MKSTNMNQVAKLVENLVVAAMETQAAETMGDDIGVMGKSALLYIATTDLGAALGENADFLLDLQKKFDNLMSHLNAEDNESAIEIQGMIAAIASDRKEGY